MSKEIIGTTRLNLNNINQEKINHNLKTIKNILKSYEFSVKEKLFFSLLSNYFEKHPNTKLTPQSLTKIYIKIGNDLGISSKDIYNNYMPNIDFSYKKEKIFNDIKAMLPPNPNIYQITITIAKYLKQHISYSFFYGFFLSQNNEKIKNILAKMNISSKEIKQLNQYLNLIVFSDPYMKKFKDILKSKNPNKIKIFLIKNFKNLSKSNQKLLLDIFKGEKVINGHSLYDYLSNTSAYDILYKYHTGICSHISLIGDFLLKNLYKGKNAKFILIENFLLNHAYNLILVKKDNKVYPIYIDFIQYLESDNPDNIFIDYGEHKFDIWGQLNNLKGKSS